MREVYAAVIAAAGGKPGSRAGRARVRSLPKAPTLAAMRLAYALKVSPLGPYHYKMIAEDFLFDTTRIKQRLGWQPTLTNEEMLAARVRLLFRAPPRDRRPYRRLRPS